MNFDFQRFSIRIALLKPFLSPGKSSNVGRSGVFRPIGSTWRGPVSHLIMHGAQVSGNLTSSLLEELINQVETVIDEETKCTHAEVANKAAATLPKQVQKTNAANFSVWLGPYVGSGTGLQRDTGTPSSAQLSYDIVRVAVGAKSNDCATLCVRTLFVEPKEPIARMYGVLLELLQVGTNALQPDVQLKEVYAKCKTHVINKDPDSVKFLPECLGYLLDPATPDRKGKPISVDSIGVARSGEIYALTLAFQNVPKPADFTCTAPALAIELTDSVKVSEKGPASLLTTTIRRYADVSYFLEGDEESQHSKATPPPASRDPAPPTRSSRRKTNTKDQLEHERTRKDHQRDLRAKKEEELRERYLNHSTNEGQSSKGQRCLSEVSAYPSPDMFPDAVRKNQVFVDARNEAVILPIHGQKVPFHVSTIKNVSKNEEGKFTYLRINFFAPGVMLRDSGYFLPEVQSPEAFYIRELTFKSADSRPITNSFRLLKELIKRVKAKGNEEQEKKDLVDQEGLILLKGKRPTLPDLIVRPNISGKKTTGTLEGHQNGLRFISNKGEKLDLAYSNIKHAIFQPVEQELTVLLHFHLRNPIMVGNKRSSDVQFYTEAGIQSDDLGVRGRGQDVDEIQQEQRERKFREKLNRDFKSFVESVQAVSNDAVEFDIPYRELGFYGVPNKSNVFLMPSVNCLVNLTEQPFFVISLSEIEVSHLERVQFSLKAFDLVFIFKDYSKLPIRISNIPVEYLDSIKDWLNDIDIIYSESTNNFNWTNVMKEVTRDMKKFVDEGGWGFLQDESSEEAAEEQSEQSDSSFEEDLSAEESQEDEDEDFSEEEESDDAESEADDSDSSEKGMDWDELEEQARKLDSKKRLAVKPPPPKRTKKN